MAAVTKNNERFEPLKLTTSMLRHHDQAMSERFRREQPSPGPFITKLRGFRLETESTPDLGQMRAKRDDDKNTPKRPSSAHNHKSNSNGSRGDPTMPLLLGDSESIKKSSAGKLDAAATVGSRESSRGRSGAGSRLRSRELAGSTTDIDVEIGVLPLLSENPAYRDWETSDASLRYLEEKVRQTLVDKWRKLGVQSANLAKR